MRPLFFLLLSLLLTLVPARAIEHSFWVDGRTKPIDDDEQALLKGMGVKKLYWVVGEAVDAGGAWVWSKFPTELTVPEGIRLVPVVRLNCKTETPFSAEMMTSLGRRLEEIVKRFGRAEVQFDCNAPDRLIGPYAKALAQLRPQVDFLGVTARLRWCEHPAFDELTNVADEIVPLFYDYEKDNSHALKPLVDVAALHAHIEAWKKCPVPWRIGLPWFARVSVYGADGEERTRATDWTWNDLVFGRELPTIQRTHDGFTVLTAKRTTHIGDTTVRADEIVVARWPDLGALAAVEKEAGHDVIYYRLPARENETSWSLAQAANIESKAAPKLVLEPGPGITLYNDSGVDLPPRLSGMNLGDRGYTLEIDAGKVLFREVLPGDFYRLEGRGDPETRGMLSQKHQAESLPVPMLGANRVLLYFSDLPAGHALKTRLFQLTPGVAATQLRYRIMGVPGAGEWKYLPLQ